MAFLFVLLACLATYFITKKIFGFLDKKVEKIVDSISGTITGSFGNAVTNSSSLLRGRMKTVGEGIGGIKNKLLSSVLDGNSTEDLDEEEEEMNKMKDNVKNLKNQNRGEGVDSSIEDEIEEADENEARRDKIAMKNDKKVEQFMEEDNQLEKQELAIEKQEASLLSDIKHGILSMANLAKAGLIYDSKTQQKIVKNLEELEKDQPDFLKMGKIILSGEDKNNKELVKQVNEMNDVIENGQIKKEEELLNLAKSNNLSEIGGVLSNIGKTLNPETNKAYLNNISAISPAINELQNDNPEFKNIKPIIIDKNQLKTDEEKEMGNQIDKINQIIKNGKDIELKDEKLLDRKKNFEKIKELQGNSQIENSEEYKNIKKDIILTLEELKKDKPDVNKLKELDSSKIQNSDLLGLVKNINNQIGNKKLEIDTLNVGKQVNQNNKDEPEIIEKTVIKEKIEEKTVVKESENSGKNEKQVFDQSFVEKIISANNTLINESEKRLNSGIIQRNFQNQSKIPVNINLISNLKKQYHTITQKTAPNTDYHKSSKAMLDKLDIIQNNLGKDFELEKDKLVKILSMNNENLKHFFVSHK